LWSEDQDIIDYLFVQECLFTNFSGELCLFHLFHGDTKKDFHHFLCLLLGWPHLRSIQGSLPFPLTSKVDAFISRQPKETTQQQDTRIDEKQGLLVPPFLRRYSPYQNFMYVWSNVGEDTKCITKAYPGYAYLAAVFMYCLPNTLQSLFTKLSEGIFPNTFSIDMDEEAETMPTCYFHGNSEDSRHSNTLESISIRMQDFCCPQVIHCGFSWDEHLVLYLQKEKWSIEDEEIYDKAHGQLRAQPPCIAVPSCFPSLKWIELLCVPTIPHFVESMRRVGAQLERLHVSFPLRLLHILDEASQIEMLVQGLLYTPHLKELVLSSMMDVVTWNKAMDRLRNEHNDGLLNLTSLTLRISGRDAHVPLYPLPSLRYLFLTKTVNSYAPTVPWILNPQLEVLRCYIDHVPPQNITTRWTTRVNIATFHASNGLGNVDPYFSQKVSQHQYNHGHSSLTPFAGNLNETRRFFSNEKNEESIVIPQADEELGSDYLNYAWFPPGNKILYLESFDILESFLFSSLVGSNGVNSLRYNTETLIVRGVSGDNNVSGILGDLTVVDSTDFDSNTTPFYRLKTVHLEICSTCIDSRHQLDVVTNDMVYLITNVFSGVERIVFYYRNEPFLSPPMVSAPSTPLWNEEAMQEPAQKQQQQQRRQQQLLNNSTSEIFDAYPLDDGCSECPIAELYLPSDLSSSEEPKKQWYRLSSEWFSSSSSQANPLQKNDENRKRFYTLIENCFQCLLSPSSSPLSRADETRYRYVSVSEHAPTSGN
jgi:hypothetical protein